MMPAGFRSFLWFSVVACGAVAQAFARSEPNFDRWLALVVTIVGGAGAVLADSPSAERRISDLRQIIRSHREKQEDTIPDLPRSHNG